MVSTCSVGSGREAQPIVSKFNRCAYHPVSQDSTDGQFSSLYLGQERNLIIKNRNKSIIELVQRLNIQKKNCNFYQPGLILNNAVSIDQLPDNRRAQLTTPWPLTILQSKVSGAGLGVWTKCDLPTGLLFGPYEGKIHKEFPNSSYSWMIYTTDGNRYIDANDPSVSNWLRYVNCGRNSFENNLAALQYNQQIFYKTIRPILRGSELMVWYGDYYGGALGIHRSSVTWQKNNQEISCSCNACNETFDYEQQLFYHFDVCSVTSSVSSESSSRECTKDEVSHLNKTKKCKTEFRNLSCNKSPYSGFQNEPNKRKRNVDHYSGCKHADEISTDEMEGKNKGVNPFVSGLSDTKRLKFVCYNCEKSYLHSCCLKRHKATCNDKDHLTCQIDQKYSFLQDLIAPDMLLEERANSEVAFNLDKVCSPNKAIVSESVKWGTPFGTIIKSPLPYSTNFSCDNCSKTFDNVFTLLLHDIEHSKSLPLQCGKCGWRFSTFTDLKCHKNLNHREISGNDLEGESENEDGYCLRSMIDCRQCECTFDSYSNWTQISTVHFNEKHSQFLDLQKDIIYGILATKEGEGSCPSQCQLNCPICYEQFDNMLDLESHKYAHIAAKMKKCKLCHVWIVSNILLKEHMKYHQKSIDISNWFCVKGLPSECAIVLPNSVVARLQWLLYKRENANYHISHSSNCQMVKDVEENVASKASQSTENKIKDFSLLLESKTNTSVTSTKIQHPLTHYFTISDNDAGRTVSSKPVNENDNFECESSQTLNKVIPINNPCQQLCCDGRDEKSFKVMEYNCSPRKGSNLLIDGTNSKTFVKEYDESTSNYVQNLCKKTILVECSENTTSSNNRSKSDLSSLSAVEIIGKGTFGNFYKSVGSCSSLTVLKRIDGATKFLLGTKSKAETDVNIGIKFEINSEFDADAKVKSEPAQEFETEFELENCKSDTATDSRVAINNEIKHLSGKKIDDRINGKETGSMPTVIYSLSNHLGSSECKIIEVGDVALENKILDTGSVVDCNNVKEEDNITVSGCGVGLEDLINYFSRFLEGDHIENKENTITIFPPDKQENEIPILTGNAGKKPFLCSSVNPNGYSSNLLISDLNLTSIIEEEKEIFGNIDYVPSPPIPKGRPILTTDIKHHDNFNLNVFASTDHQGENLSHLIQQEMFPKSVSNGTARRSCDDNKNLVGDDAKFNNESNYNTTEMISNDHLNTENYHYNLRNDSNFKFYSCKVCGKTFQNLSLVDDHKRIHKAKLQLRCKHCEMKFKDQNKYLFHLTTHIQFLSCQCGAKFANYFSLVRHQSLTDCMQNAN